MTFTLTLSRDGHYEKLGGPPLVPGQRLLLDEGVYFVPHGAMRESRFKGCTIRAWAIPVEGGFRPLSEVLVPDSLLPKEAACTNP